MDKGKAQFLGCSSKAIELATGIRFGIPKNEALGEKPVSWEIMTAPGVKNIIDTPVTMDALDRGDTSKQRTDKNGESKIKLTGKPQPQDLTGEKVVPIRKTVDLKASIALENMDFKNDVSKIGKIMIERTDDGFGEAGSGLATMTSGLVLGIIELIPEILSKMKLRSQTIRVPVRDWTPCSDDWGGFINFKRELKRPPEIIKATRNSNGNSSGDGIREVIEHEEAEIVLNPRKPEEVKTKPKIPANIYVSGNRLNVFTGNRENDPCCGTTEGKFNTKFRRGKEETYATALKRALPTDAEVNISATERDFYLELSFETDQFPTKLRDFYEVTQTSCSLEEDEAKSEEVEGIRQLKYRLDPGRYGVRFVNSEGELLQGEKTVTGPDGATITWNWALARCKSNLNRA